MLNLILAPSSAFLPEINFISTSSVLFNLCVFTHLCFFYLQYKRSRYKKLLFQCTWSTIFYLCHLFICFNLVEVWFGPHLAIFRAYFCLSTQGSLLASSEGTEGDQTLVSWVQSKYHTCCTIISATWFEWYFKSFGGLYTFGILCQFFILLEANYYEYCFIIYKALLYCYKYYLTFF